MSDSQVITQRNHGYSSTQPPLVVTALHDVGKASLAGGFQRPFTSYRKSLLQLLPSQSPLVVYAADELWPWIKAARGHAPLECKSLSDAQLRSHPWYRRMEEIRTSSAWLGRAAWLPKSPQAALPLYLPLVLSKLTWLGAEASERPSDSALFWVDGGILAHLPGRNATSIDQALGRAAASCGDRFFVLGFNYETGQEVHGFERTAMARHCGTDYVDRVCRAGFMGGSPAAVAKVSALCDEILRETLADGCLGTEENLLTIASYQAPELFHVKMLPTGSVDSFFPLVGFAGKFKAKTSQLRHPKQALRRLVRRGAKVFAERRAAFQKPIWSDLITRAAPLTLRPRSDLDLHILVCRNDVMNALWAVRTFLGLSGLAPRLFWHDDGSLTASDRALLLKQHPLATYVSREESDQAMREVLHDYPSANRYRFKSFHWPSIKLLDFAHYSAGRAFMILDADVLFFRRPLELLDAIERKMGFFMNDMQEAYVWPPARWPQLFGVPGLSKVNVGLMGVPLGEYDLNFIEHCLRRYEELSPTPRPQWLEQNVWGALFSRNRDRYVRLSKGYGISTAHAINTDAVAHHFTRDGTPSRPNFMLKGLRHLQRCGTLKTLGIS